MHIPAGLGKALRRAQGRRQEKIIHMHAGPAKRPAQQCGGRGFSGGGHTVQAHHTVAFLLQNIANGPCQRHQLRAAVRG